MKTEWTCRGQYIPGREKHLETYSTRDGARRAMAKVLTDGVELSSYINALRKEDGEDCGSSADFLEKFFSDLVIPESEEEIPPHLDIPDHCLLEIHSSEGFRWEYARRECPSLRVSHVNYGSDGHPFIIDFAFESPAEIKPDRVNSIRIQIDEHINYGTSAYPLMVLFALQEHPQTQEQIIRAIYQTWDTTINRKAVGRHLQLLQDMGFPVAHSPEGFFNNGKYAAPKADIQYSSSAYPLLIMQVLDETPKTQTAIMKEIQDKYGAKIGRKAIVQNLELLDVLGCNIQKCKAGYYIV